MAIDIDYLDMLEIIELNENGAYSWADQDFIESIWKQIDSGKELTKKQIESIENIYNKGA